jgi:hypothetical protein
MEEPAFPVQSVYIEDQGTNSRGMTLRDYFAAKAMQSLIVVYSDDKNLVGDYAQRAFEIADAMLEARK